MNITNQYIIQAIVIAANNLRLSSEKIEIISILKHFLSESDAIEDVIVQMKKVTELSKLAIKLGKLHEYITSDSIDFLKLSDMFKEQSHSLVIEFSNLLDTITSASFREILDGISNSKCEVDVAIKTPQSEILDKYQPKLDINDTSNNINLDNQIKINKKLKENLILSEPLEIKQNGFDYDIFEKTIVKPIKAIEELLKRVLEVDFDKSEIIETIELLQSNAILSKESGFNLLAEMHTIIVDAFNSILSDELEINSDTIENIRACLIVIVAAVREKDVDISNYLKRAEHFGVGLRDN